MLLLRALGFLPRPRIGLLGGSFNPAHDGHRQVSLEALARLHLDEVWWLVAPQNPLKPVAGMAPLDERLAAARRVAADPRIKVTAIEAALGTRYTADSLRALARSLPRSRLIWLMGADNLAQLPRWRAWPRIFHTLPIAILDRDPYTLWALAGRAAQRFRRWRLPARRAGVLAQRQPPAWVFLRIRRHPASATAIRRARAMRTGAAGG